MNEEKPKINIMSVSITSTGVSYKLDGNTAFKDRWISHERIVEMFYELRGVKVEAINCIDKNQSEGGV